MRAALKFSCATRFGSGLLCFQVSLLDTVALVAVRCPGLKRKGGGGGNEVKSCGRAVELAVCLCGGERRRAVVNPNVSVWRGTAESFLCFAGFALV